MKVGEGGGPRPDLDLIVGCARSDTTWLQLLLSQHEAVASLKKFHPFDHFVGPFLRNWDALSKDPRGLGLESVMAREEFMGFLRDFDDDDVAQISTDTTRLEANFTVREGEEPVLHPPHHFPKTDFIIGANMAFRKVLFHELDGFDERLGLGTPFPCEEIELCARASDRGFQGGYFPQLTVFNHHGRKEGPQRPW